MPVKSRPTSNVRVGTLPLLGNRPGSIVTMMMMPWMLPCCCFASGSSAHNSVKLMMINGVISRALICLGINEESVANDQASAFVH